MKVMPWHFGQVTEHFQAAMFALGYEQRAGHILGNSAVSFSHGYGCAFADRNVLSYGDNIEIARRRGLSVESVPDTSICEYWNSVINDCLNRIQGLHQPSILCDVSSFSRYRIASFVEACDAIARERQPFDVVFAYSIAHPNESQQSEIYVRNSGPVSQKFAGAIDDADQKLWCGLGVGSQRSAAIGVVEYLEPDDFTVFVPRGENVKYKKIVEEANRDLLSLANRDQLVIYELREPYDAYLRVRIKTGAMLEKGRVVLVSFGPKLFGTIGLLVACFYDFKVCVWHLRSSVDAEPIQRIATGEVVGIRATFP